MAKTPPVIKTAQGQRAAQVKRQDKASADLLKIWRKIAKDLRQQMDAITARLSESIKETGSPSATLLYEKAHLQKLLDETVEQVNKYSDTVKTGIKEQQAENVAHGVADAKALAQVAVNQTPMAGVAMQWAAVDPSHIETLAEKLKPGGAVDEELKKIAPEAARKLSDAILTRVGMGEQPESVARDFDSVLGAAAAKFMTIARTANMDAYRNSQTAFFKANKDIVSGWQWMASLSFDTCPACLAMNGKFFREDEEMESHFNCRCVPIPVIKGFESEPMQSGEDWLRSQPEDIQRKVLGPGKYDLWRQGKISLQDMVAHSHHDSKGWMYHEATINQALENAVKSGGGVSQIEYDPRISDSVKNHVQGELRQRVEHTFDIVESVHEPVVARNKYNLIRASGIKDNGYFDKLKKEIGIKPDGEHVELTVAHELGHQFHIEGFEGSLTSSGYPSLDSEELKGLKHALENSDAITQLRDIQQSSRYTKVFDGLEFETKFAEKVEEEEQRRIRTYLTEHEQFSRAYAQYITQKSGDPTLAGQLQDVLQHNEYHRFSQWTQEDFTPIAHEFDIILRDKGLRK